MKPLKVCTTNGCPNLTRNKHCHQHRNKQPRNTQPTSHYSTAHWRNTRRKKLKTTPLCEHCGRIATTIHHLDHRSLDGPNAHNPQNLQALCTNCHNHTTATERLR